MNGLEAIELMQQGKVVVSEIMSRGIIETFIFKIIDDNVYHKWLDLEEGEWVIETDFDFTQIYEEYIEPKPLTGWERVEGDSYETIASTGTVDTVDFGYCMDVERYEIANYFSTKEKAEEIAFKQTLFRKLQRFSDNNGGIEIDWNDYQTNKYSVAYYHSENKFTTHHVRKMQAPGTVYFVSREVAEKAIELFHDELIEYFTHDWSGRNE